MKEEAHIKAMRRGIQKIFSQNLWDTGVPAKNGWERLGDVKAIEKIETETVTVVETDPPSEEKIYPTKDEIWDYLKQLHKDGKLDKLPHHATGEKKLRKIFDEYEDTE